MNWNNKKVKLVADSSANIHWAQNKMDITYVPLKIILGNREYVDNADLDVLEMIKDMKEYKDKSSTACPSVRDWLEAFEGADILLGVSITSGLSGSYNSARIAVQEYISKNKSAKVFILDSLSTGPEMQLILEKYQQLISEGKEFEEICALIQEYHTRTHLLFVLESLDNFVKNGRVKPAVAKAVGLLGLRIIGRASTVGILEVVKKCRGEKKALKQILASMKEMGYAGGRVRITHSYNPSAGYALADVIKGEYPKADIGVNLNRGLCCYYAEEGGILMGFEGK